MVAQGTMCQSEAIERETVHDGEPKKKLEAEVGVFSSFHSNHDYVSEILGVTKFKASISGREAEFQEVLNDIDFNISKFDTPTIGPSKSGPILEVDQAKCLKFHSGVSEGGLSLETNEIIGLNCSFQGVEISGRG